MRDLAARYQNQKWPVRYYRWLRWKPWYALLAFVDILRYRRIWADFRISLWSLRMADACMKMEHWHTMEEVFKDTGERQS